jgi:uncharacterized protein YqjF (DUF2071 family)
VNHPAQADTGPDGDRMPPGVCPYTVDRPVMRQRWERLTFLHWPYEPGVVQRLLPPGLHVETFDGAAWVGLVPFFMRVATPGGRRAPWVSDFCETNVRTYVRDDAGRPGIWFLSLDAARLGAVVVARTTYRLPYFWSAMRLRQRRMDTAYLCQRRWPGPRGATSRVRVSAGAPFDRAELTERDHFLTARWRLFSVIAGRTISAQASHQPWPLRRATVRLLDDHLLTAAGLPEPGGEPLVHYSPGVDVAIGLPEPGPPASA